MLSNKGTCQKKGEERQNNELETTYPLLKYEEFIDITNIWVQKSNWKLNLSESPNVSDSCKEIIYFLHKIYDLYTIMTAAITHNNFAITHS